MVALALPSLPTITSAFLLKLTTSLDDLLWLSPFLSLSPSVQNKFKHSVVYFIICVVVTMVAFIFGTSLLALMTRGDASQHVGFWNPERILSVFSASVLFYIARNDYTEWKEENYKSGKEEKETTSSRMIALGDDTTTTIEMSTTKASSNNKSSQQKLRARATASRQNSRTDLEDYNSGSNNSGDDSDSDDSDSDDEEIRTKVQEASKSLRRFVTVCVMGTLDDMIVFSAFVAGGAGKTTIAGTTTTTQSMINNYLALFIGTTFAALLIVTISWFFSEIECFKRIVKKIPMWALLTGIAVYILVMGMI